MKVLIADDDEVILRMLEIGLSGAGHTVRTAKDGMRAFAYAKKDAPDVILLDINMPGGSGFEVLGLIKSSPLTKEIPVVIITGSADSDVEQKAKDLGAAAFLAKPFGLEAINAAIAAHGRPPQA